MRDQRPGFVAVLVEGKGAFELFRNEAGGHRWQRVPPNDKRGRVQTSTVTVAVLSFETKRSPELDARDIDIRTARGSGPGGQHRNKRDSCVTATHRPSGARVRVDMRSQHQSRSQALAILRDRIEENATRQRRATRARERRDQVGSGMRGDKIRTYRELDDRVVDHRTGESWRLCDWLRGRWS